MDIDQTEKEIQLQSFINTCRNNNLVLHKENIPHLDVYIKHYGSIIIEWN